MAFCGPSDQNLRRLERGFNGTVAARGDERLVRYTDG